MLNFGQPECRLNQREHLHILTMLEKSFLYTGIKSLTAASLLTICIY